MKTDEITALSCLRPPPPQFVCITIVKLIIFMAFSSITILPSIYLFTAHHQCLCHGLCPHLLIGHHSFLFLKELLWLLSPQFSSVWKCLRAAVSCTPCGSVGGPRWLLALPLTMWPWARNCSCFLLERGTPICAVYPICWHPLPTRGPALSPGGWLLLLA